MPISSPNLGGWGARAALLGGALSVAEGILILANPGYYGFDSPLDHVVSAVEGAALVVLLGGLVGLHARQAESYGSLGRAGFFVAFVGTALAAAGHLAAVPFFDFLNVGGMVYVLVALREGFFVIGGMAYAMGAVLMSAGLVLLGVATARAGMLSVWIGPALIAGLVSLWVAGNVWGWVLFGLTWVSVGHMLRTERGATARLERRDDNR